MRNFEDLYIIFLQACIDDNLDMVEFLVANGADVDRGDNEGWTPLHATASCGFLSIARLDYFCLNLHFKSLVFLGSYLTTGATWQQ